MQWLYQCSWYRTDNNDLSEGRAIENLFTGKIPMSVQPSLYGHYDISRGFGRTIIQYWASVWHYLAQPELSNPMPELKFQPAVEMIRGWTWIWWWATHLDSEKRQFLIFKSMAYINGVALFPLKTRCPFRFSESAVEHTAIFLDLLSLFTVLYWSHRIKEIEPPD